MPSKIKTTMEQELTFTLTIEEANSVLQGLQELPAKVANPLTRKLQDQATKQLQPAQPEGSQE
jgi:hypothetical protein